MTESGDASDRAAGEQVVLLICCYNDRHHLEPCLASVRASDDRPLDRRTVVVDNGSTDGTAAFLAREHPDLETVRVEPNRGFTGGNNAGWRHARRAFPGASALVLLNADTVVGPGWLRPLIAALRARGHNAAAQAKLLLHHAPDRLNSAGNRCQYLGFGFPRGYGERDNGQWDDAEAIDFASGAAVALDREAVERFGLFDEAFYMTHEDTDLGCKLRQAGRGVVFAPQSVVRHKYKPTTPVTLYRQLERNRWLLLLTYYKWRTLLLLAPALVAMELGQVLFCLRRRLFRERIAVYAWFLRRRNRRTVAVRRRRARRRRRIPDRAFLGGFAGRIDSAVIDDPLWHRLGNPVFAGYWRLARRLIRW